MTVEQTLRVAVTDGRGRPVRAEALRRWLVDVAPRGAARGEVAVALVGDRKMRALNRRFRRIDRPTDVLSFPVARGLGSPAPRRRPPVAEPRFLGDIVIATGVARRQARAAGHRLGTELRCLALHGLLHLLGYDHARDGGRMMRLERRLRRRGGIA